MFFQVPLHPEFVLPDAAGARRMPVFCGETKETRGSVFKEYAPFRNTQTAESPHLIYKGTAAHKDPAMTLPTPALRDGSLDFSFSGLKTAAINLLHRYEQRGQELDRALFAARYTYEAVEAVASKIGAALDENPDCDLVVAGGVAANSHLRRRLTEVASKRGRRIFIPPASLCGDNAAMIAASGYYEYVSGNLADSSLNASALDSVV